MRTNGCFLIRSRPSTFSLIEASTISSFGLGLGDRADAVGLVDQIGRRVLGVAGDDLQRFVGGRERVLALEAHIKRGAHQQHQVRPVITVPVSQAKLSSRPCGISPSVDATRQRRPVLEAGAHQSERAIALRRVHPRSCPDPVIVVRLARRRPLAGPSRGAQMHRASRAACESSRSGIGLVGRKCGKFPAAGGRCSPPLATALRERPISTGVGAVGRRRAEFGVPKLAVANVGFVIFGC